MAGYIPKIRSKAARTAEVIYADFITAAEDAGGEIMTVRGRTIYHCHGKKKGKRFRTYKTAGQAHRVHRAIQAKKHGGKK